MAASMVETKRGCWTCKDRKVRCDKTFPTCNNCGKANRSCGGYGVRLSWGQQSDRRRHQVAPEPFSSSSKTLHFINTKNSDTSAVYEFVKGGDYHLRDHHPIPRQVSILRPNMRLGHDEPALLSYFQVMVASLFSSIHDASDHLRETLLRMAFHRSDLSSLAVYRCILALSSMRLYSSGDSRAKVYYSDAVSTLAKSVQISTGNAEYLQHIASSMLLNVYEVFDPLKQSPNWPWYFCGSKTIVKLVYESGQAYSGDEADLFDWVFYHEALSKFSICHYAARTTQQLACADDHHLKSKQALSPKRQIITGVAGCSPELLEIMTELFTAVRKSAASEDDDAAYQGFKLRLSSLKQEVSPRDCTTSRATDRLATTAELIRVACLIYLERAARGVPPWNTEVEKLVEFGISLLQQLGTCERPFPLFVIACEAHTDEQRQIVLGVLAQTLKRRDVGNLGLVKTMIETAWVHDDLHDVEDLPALVKYNSVLSACSALPAFT